MLIERDLNMKTFSRAALVALVAVFAATAFVGGCNTAQNYCAKREECLREDLDTDLEPDSTRVCAVEIDGQIATLRANEEDDCHILADALVALRNCQAGLKCDDFFEGDLGGECDDQLDNFEDARDDADGLTCTAQD